MAACQVIFDSDDNLLLSSGTASGKTEAAFLPVLTQLYEKPSASVGVVYISPLKALINDQFKRLDLLLADSGIPVTKWHGAASATGHSSDYAGVPGEPGDKQKGSMHEHVLGSALCNH